MAEQLAIAISQLKPNPWNPNIMDDTTWNALGESVEEFGIDIDPLLVRPIGKNIYQIIDGEHRYKWAKERGEKTLPCVVKELSDSQAKRLTQIMNRTRGEDDPEKLKQLFDDLLASTNPDEVIRGMAIASTNDLQAMLADLEEQTAIKNFDWDAFEDAENPTRGDIKERGAMMHKCPQCSYIWEE